MSSNTNLKENAFTVSRKIFLAVRPDTPGVHGGDDGPPVLRAASKRTADEDIVIATLNSRNLPLGAATSVTRVNNRIRCDDTSTLPVTGPITPLRPMIFCQKSQEQFSIVDSPSIGTVVFQNSQLLPAKKGWLTVKRCGRPRFLPDIISQFEQDIPSPDHSSHEENSKTVSVTAHALNTLEGLAGSSEDTSETATKPKSSSTQLLRSFSASEDTRGIVPNLQFQVQSCKDGVRPSSGAVFSEMHKNGVHQLHREQLDHHLWNSDKFESTRIDALVRHGSNVLFQRRSDSALVRMRLDEAEESTESSNDNEQEGEGENHHVNEGEDINKNEEEKTKMKANRANWMQMLPEDIKEKPLNTLFIPGSHDSCSHRLRGVGPAGPDAPPLARVMVSVLPCIALPVFKRWSQTQRAEISEQLRNGVRYFDLRVAEKDGKFHFVHGLFGDEMESILGEMSVFLASHPGEVLVLDFQHLYGFTAGQHRRLVDVVRAVLGRRLCPVQPVYLCTLRYLINNGYQALVFYRSSSGLQSARVTRSAGEVLWSAHVLPNPWPRVTRAEDMIQFLEKSLGNKGEHTFHVTQCVLTPTPRFLLPRLCCSLESMLALPANQALEEALPGLMDRVLSCNIVMTDFVEYQDYALPRAVILRNYHGLDHPVPQL